jgi:uncharacterized tellurite resistance protein B-like protein
MLFSFFKKHEQLNTINKHLGDFQGQFSENQKKAILNSLLLIACSDGEYHQTEADFFEQAATLLGYRLNHDYANELSSFSRDKLFQLLNSLNESQKDWYIITVFGMMYADGEALKIESQYLDALFNNMGITEERFEKVLSKTQFIMNKDKL